MGGQIKKHIIRDILLLGLGVFAVFGLFSLQSHAQQTGAPGQDTNSSNISDLLRITDPDGIQVKPGALRVGNSGTLDISSTFEVYGDLHSSGSLLIVAEGTCNDATNTLEPACTFSTIGQKYPTFVADVAQNYVGVGTNNPTGKLALYSQQNEFVNGAVYATSTAGNSVWGVTSANNAAGILGLAINPNSVAVYGKSIDKYSRGVSGFSNGTGAPAGLFWGNVVVTGGYIQGNASGLYRVSSINDSSLTVAEGGRGIGAWANGEPIIVNASTNSLNPQTIALPFNSGERIRSLTVYARVKDTGSYKLLDSTMPITVSMTPQQLTFTNSSASQYQVIVFAHIENTLSITIEHPGTNGAIYAVNNTQPVLYAGNGLYEMRANVGPGLSDEFTWKFSTPSPRGQLCYKQSEGVAVNCVSTSGAINAETVYYKFPASYTGNYTWQDPVEVTWAGSTDVVRTVNLKVIDIQTPTTPIVAQYNAGNGTVPRVNIPVTYKTPSGIGQISELTFEPVIPEGESPRNIEDIDSSGNYRAPEIALDDLAALGSRGVTAPISISPTTNPGAEKIVTLYLVPNVNLQTHYAFAAAPQTDAEDTNTTAASKPLNVVATITGYNGATPANTLTCSGCTSGTSSPWGFTKTASNLGPHLIQVTWTPTSGYPAGVQLVKSKTVYVSTLVAANASGAYNTNIVVPVTVNFNATGTELATILSALHPSVYQLNQTVPVGTDYTLNPTVKGGSGHVTGITSVNNNNVSEITFNSSSCNNGSPYSVSLRNPSDLREEKTVNITVTGCPTNTCTNCSGCPNDLKHCDPCCTQNTNGVVIR